LDVSVCRINRGAISPMPTLWSCAMPSPRVPWLPNSSFKPSFRSTLPLPANNKSKYQVLQVSLWLFTRLGGRSKIRQACRPITSLACAGHFIEAAEVSCLPASLINFHFFLSFEHSFLRRARLVGSEILSGREVEAAYGLSNQEIGPASRTIFDLVEIRAYASSAACGYTATRVGREGRGGRIHRQEAVSAYS